MNTMSQNLPTPDHARNMVLAGTIMFVVAQISPQRLMRFAVPLYSFGVMLLIAVAIFGITKKGAKRWINVGVVIQPSEILKIAMPYLGTWVSQAFDWTPLKHFENAFEGFNKPEIDRKDPWQFKNFLVTDAG